VTTQRYGSSIDSVAVANTIADSAAVNFENFERGMIYVPAGSSITSITWHCSTKASGTYLPARNESSVALVTTVAAGQAYPIPEVLSGAMFLKMVGNAAGVVGVTMKD
jgi:hypothetical protein